ncbi:Holliday junction resolvase RuvX [Mesomycoplasma conjunctivae]|uniref:Holliday junction resolvase RuvX n=1 Tax=Mesomycoplasma conjunctivae TaxID=45361 RepID=UPI003DA560B5
MDVKKRILALDLGTKTCGFAITDPLAIIAQSLENFTYKNGDLNQIVLKIQDLQRQYEIGKIVLGYPLYMNGNKAPHTLLVEKMSSILKQNFQIPVVLQDERLSTSQAHDILILANVSRKKRKKVIDKLAAQIILERYLSEN